MVPCLQKQLDSLHGQFSEDQSITEAFRVMTESQFEKGYLRCAVPEEEESAARDVLQSTKEQEEELSRLEATVAEKEASQEEMKPPLLFGRARYRREVDAVNAEIEQIRSTADEVKGGIEGAKEDLERAKATIVKADASRKENDAQYAVDERAFWAEKMSLVAPSMSSHAEELSTQDWDESKDFFKELMRMRSAQTLFPHIGWGFAMGYAQFLVAEESAWKDHDETIIVQGEAVSLREALEGFLESYIVGDTCHEDEPLYHLIKASICFARMERAGEESGLESLMRLHAHLERLDDRGRMMHESMCRILANDEKHGTGASLKAIFSSVETAKRLALAKGDESALDLAVTEENRYGEALGWLLEYAE